MSNDSDGAGEMAGQVDSLPDLGTKTIQSDVKVPAQGGARERVDLPSGKDGRGFDIVSATSRVKEVDAKHRRDIEKADADFRRKIDLSTHEDEIARRQRSEEAARKRDETLLAERLRQAEWQRKSDKWTVIAIYASLLLVCAAAALPTTPEAARDKILVPLVSLLVGIIGGRALGPGRPSELPPPRD